METVMIEVDAEKFNKMYRQHTEMYDTLSSIKKALLGDEFRKDGVIAEIQEMKDTFKSHDKEDKENFKVIFEFQKRQMLFVGWTGVLIRVVGGGLLVIAGYAIQLFSK